MFTFSTPNLNDIPELYEIMLNDFAKHCLHPCLLVVLFFTAFVGALQHFLELYEQLEISGMCETISRNVHMHVRHPASL